MRLEHITIRNFKSFDQSPPIQLAPDITLVTGANDAGKTAFLQALGFRLDNLPHKSEKTLPTSTSVPNRSSRVDLTFSIDHDELQDLLQNQVGSFNLPHPHGNDEETIARELLKTIDAQERLSCRCTYDPSNGKADGFIATRIPAVLCLEEIPSTERTTYRRFTWDDERRITLGAVDNSKDRGDLDLGIELAKRFKRRLYFFDAERLKVGECGSGSSRDLSSDARNLPEVLDTLLSNPGKRDRYNTLVRRVFPQIAELSVRVKPGTKDMQQIIVWHQGVPREREDLAIPLLDSGTGLAQVLSILYVLVDSPYPRTIIIDEPNSFLNPGAAKVLVDILRIHRQHQFILSTHSPEIITRSRATVHYHLEKVGSETTINSIDTRQASEAAALLRNLGASVGDVFGADQVLWVEGQTEEEAFPEILEHFRGDPIDRISILGVFHTADFDRKRVVSAVRLHSKLSAGPSLIPPCVGFLFDREEKTDKEITDLERIGKGPVSFLPRRCFENYLLDPDAIAAVLSTLPTFASNGLDVSRVTEWLSENGDRDCYLAEADQSTGANLWQNTVHAPKLLKDLWSELSEGKEFFKKPEHPVALCKWIMREKPESLRELGQLLARKVSNVKESSISEQVTTPPKSDKDL